MNVTNWLAWKYLRAQRHHRFFSWVSGLTILGMTIGVMTLILVVSVVDGYEEELRKRFLAANAHILLYKYPDGMRNDESWYQKTKKILKKNFLEASPFVQGDTIVSHDYRIQSVLVKGIDVARRENVQSLKEIVKPSSSLQLMHKGYKVVVGKTLLSILDLNVGDYLEIFHFKNGDQKTVPYEIIGCYDSGLQHYDSKLVLMPLSTSQDLMGYSNEQITGWEIGLKNPMKSEEALSALKKAYPHLSVTDWQAFNKNFFEMIRGERNLIAFLVALVAFVAGFNILATLFVSVTQKQKDISLLKALGADRVFILKLFWKQGLIMGGLGCFWGILGAKIFSEFLKRYPIVRLPDSYLLSSLPISSDWEIYVWAALLSLTMAGFSSIYPAWKASQISPIFGLKWGSKF